jgi:hypothetical protein
MKAILDSFDEELRLSGVEFAVVIIPSYFNIVDVSKFEKVRLEESQFGI